MTVQPLVKTQSQKATVVQDARGREFWTNELEVAYDQIKEQAGQPGFMQNWISKRSGRQLDVLRNNMSRDANSKRGERNKEGLQSKVHELLPYVLVQEFAKFKSKLATIEVALNLLSPDVMDLCNKEDDDYDTLALCFAIYRHAPFELRQVLHIDKVYKSGFARMKMKDGPRRPKRPLIEFLTHDGLQESLVKFDKSRKDGRTSELKNILHDRNHDMVFIRRCERPTLMLQGHTVLHGYRPEWIVLAFSDGAKRVNISSRSVDASLEIANQIAAEYYGTKCEYQNESEIAYRKQLERFLDLLKNDRDEQMVWVELVMGNSPLDGECPFRIRDPKCHSIAPAVRHFERAVGSLTGNVDAIESIKVFLRQETCWLDLRESGASRGRIRRALHRPTTQPKRTTGV